MKNLSSAQIEAACRLLEEKNVPPVTCPNCGAQYYVIPPEGWAPGTPLAIECECGLEWTFEMS